MFLYHETYEIMGRCLNSKDIRIVATYIDNVSVKVSSSSLTGPNSVISFKRISFVTLVYFHVDFEHLKVHYNNTADC